MERGPEGASAGSAPAAPAEAFQETPGPAGEGGHGPVVAGSVPSSTSIPDLPCARVPGTRPSSRTIPANGEENQAGKRTASGRLQRTGRAGGPLRATARVLRVAAGAMGRRSPVIGALVRDRPSLALSGWVGVALFGADPWCRRSAEARSRARITGTTGAFLRFFRVLIRGCGRDRSAHCRPDRRAAGKVYSGP